MATPKRKSLADRIRSQRKISTSERQREKELLAIVTNQPEPQTDIETNNSITQGSTEDQVKIKSVSLKDQVNITNGSGIDQDSITQGSTEDQIDIKSVSDKDQLNISSISDKDQIKSRSHGDTIKSEPGKVNNLVINDNCIDLTATQMKVYNWFKNNGEKGYFNKSQISKDTDIAYITIRKTIKKLESNRLVFFGDYDPTIRLETYKINTHICGVCGIELTGQEEFNTKNSIALNSSSKFLKTNELTKILSENPDLEYWRSKKLKPAKIESWIKECSISLDDMIESLAHCAFEMIESNETDKKGQKIRNVMDWFYKIIKSSRYYDKPPNFMTFEEKAIERAEKRLKEKQERIKKLKDLEKQEREADLTLKLHDVLEDPEGDMYKKCLAHFPKIQKQRFQASSKQYGPAFEKEMKRALEKILYDESETE